MMTENLILPLESDVKQVVNIDVKEVPSFPLVLAKLLEICNDENATMEELSKLVETDPGISAKVLGIVNSASYGLRRKITAVKQAVIHLGFDEVKTLSLGIAVFEKMFKSGTQKQFDRMFFWRHCLCVAVLSMAIAEELEYPKPGEAYFCGLLHDLGKILLDQYGRVNYDDCIANVTKSTSPMIVGEQELMGMGHDDLGAYYSSLWNLPASLVLTIKYHHQRYEHLECSKEDILLVSIVSLANYLAWTQGMGSVDINRLPVLQPEVEKNIDLGTIDFIQIIKRMDREMENTSRFYHFIFPSANQFRENMLRTNLMLGRINTGYYYRDQDQTGTIGLLQIKNSITTPHHSLDPKAIITTTLNAIHKDFKFNRLYVMKVVKNLRSLNVFEVFDTTDIKMDLKSIEIPLDKEAGGFVHCLRGKAPVMITGKTSGEKTTLKKFKLTEMLIVPFCCNNKVIGILGMDNIQSQKALLPDIFSSIAIVANELGMAMENAGAYKEAKAISLKDGLTGLLNRVAIDELLTKSFRKAVDGKHDLSLVMIDVDYFKKFNDKFGHQAGDTILKLIAGTLKKMTRPFDHVGRYGGEEFIVILNDTDLSKALVYAERIRRNIFHLGELLKDRFPGLSLSVSAGVSEYHPNVKNRDSLIAGADKALYLAKESGRNRIASG